MKDATSEPETRRECWICFESAGAEGPLLVSPCACTTSVHPSCMMKWFGPKTVFRQTFCNGVAVRGSLRPSTVCEVCRGDVSDTIGALVTEAILHVIPNFEDTTRQYRPDTEREVNLTRCVAFVRAQPGADTLILQKC